MSATISATRYNVRIALGDLDDGAYAIDNERLTRILVRQAQLHNALAGVSETYEAVGDVFSTASGTVDYTLHTAGGRQFDAVLSIKGDDGRVLKRRTLDEIEALLGDVQDGEATPAADPTAYAIFELTGPVATVRVFPVPNRVENMEAIVRMIAVAAYTDATVIDGSEYLLRAIELATASEAAARIAPDERERIKLAADVLSLWKEDARVLLRHERERKSRLRAVSHVPAQVGP